jgi:hypothetical protein
MSHSKTDILKYAVLTSNFSQKSTVIFQSTKHNNAKTLIFLIKYFVEKWEIIDYCIKTKQF